MKGANSVLNIRKMNSGGQHCWSEADMYCNMFTKKRKTGDAGTESQQVEQMAAPEM